MTTKLCIIGGAGFVGSHIVDRLIELNYEVIVIDNLSTGKKENINKKAKFYKCDILNYKKLEQIFKKEKPDIVNHQAAQVSVPKSVKNPQFDAKTNIIGTINLLELSKKYKVKKFIYASSGGAVYGELLPTPEINFTTPLSPYGISKLTAEYYVASSNLPYVILRYSNVYGNRDIKGVIPIFINKLLKNQRPCIYGDCIRDYINVKDVVSANIFAIALENQIFNVGTGISTSTKELFGKIQKLLKSDIEPKYEKERLGDLKFSCLNSDKLQNLGWKIRYDLEIGLEETIKHNRLGR